MLPPLLSQRNVNVKDPHRQNFLHNQHFSQQVFAYLATMQQTRWYMAGIQTSAQSAFQPKLKWVFLQSVTMLSFLQKAACVKHDIFLSAALAGIFQLLSCLISLFSLFCGGVHVRAHTRTQKERKRGRGRERESAPPCLPFQQTA